MQLKAVATLKVNALVRSQSALKWKMVNECLNGHSSQAQDFDFTSHLLCPCVYIHILKKNQQNTIFQ